MTFFRGKNGHTLFTNDEAIAMMDVGDTLSDSPGEKGTRIKSFKQVNGIKVIDEIEFTDRDGARQIRKFFDYE